MITMDCLLEVLSAALLIVANIYCSGDPPASLIYFTNINFSKLNTIIILNEKKIKFYFLRIYSIFRNSRILLFVHIWNIIDTQSINICGTQEWILHINNKFCKR
jgi:hypothetical protein